MSIIEKMTKIVNDGDVAAGEQMIHDDYQFLMHSFLDGSNPVTKPIWDEVMESYEIFELNKL